MKASEARAKAMSNVNINEVLEYIYSEIDAMVSDSAVFKSVFTYALNEEQKSALMSQLNSDGYNVRISGVTGQLVVLIEVSW